MVQTVTRPYARRFVDWAREREEVLCLSADLTGSCEVDTSATPARTGSSRSA